MPKLASNSWWFQQIRKYQASQPRIIREIHPLSYYTQRLELNMTKALEKRKGNGMEAENTRFAIQEVAQEAMLAFDRAVTSNDIEAACQVADHITKFREIIEPHMPKLLTLCDSPLGFRTDRSPEALERNKKKGRGVTEPYEPELIKECILEALLRGLSIAGDQFNIIGGRCYVPMNGYTALLNKTGVKRLCTEVVLIEANDKQHIAEGHAKWYLDGKPYEMKKRFFLKAFGAITTWEQTEGKAMRKLLKAVYQRVTGRAFQDDDEGVTEEDVKDGAIDVGGQEVEEGKPASELPGHIKTVLSNLEGAGIPEAQFVDYLVGNVPGLETVQPPPATLAAIGAIDSGIIRIVATNWERSLARFKESSKPAEVPA